jgi:hypothetical protein
MSGPREVWSNPSMARPTRSLIAMLVTFAAANSTPAAAQELDDKFWLELEAYWPKVDTTVQVSSVTDNTIGTKIDFERDLVVDNSKTLPAFSAGARISRKFRVVAEYYSLGRSSETMLTRDIVFDNVRYPVAATVKSDFDSAVYRLSFGWSFLRKPNVEMGAAIGLHATDFKISLDGQGSVNGATAQTEARRKKLLAPLPTLGLYGDYEAAPGFVIGGNVDFLSLKYGDYDGRLVNAQAEASYRVWRNIALGVMYRYVDYRVDVKKPEWTGRLTYKFNGPAIFLHAGF